MLVASNRMLDFGLGFYTTTNREQNMIAAVDEFIERQKIEDRAHSL